QSNGVASYSIVNGHCDCRDFAQAPHGFCKHRLSAAIARRAAELVPSAPPADDAPWPEMAPVHEERPMAQPQPRQPAPLPEAPASCNVYVLIGGHKVQVTLRDTDEHRMLARLQTLLAQYPAAPERGREAQAPPPSPEPEPEQRYCPRHGTEMQLNHKDGRSW